MEIITPSQAREAGRELGLKLVAQDNANSQEWKEMISDIEQTPLTAEGMEEIGALLALPDNQFALIAPAFLDELEKSYNSVNQQILLVQAMNAAGRHIEDIEAEYLALCDIIDTQMATQLTAPKRDFLKRLIGLTYNSIAGMDGIAKKTINIPIEFCHPDAKTPAYAHPSDAGMDVYALEEITINPGETKLIPLGIKVAIPLGYELQVRPKSGRCLKTKLRVANAPGTIDAGYRDEVGVIIENVDPPIRAIHTEFAQSPNDPIPVGAIEFGQSYTIGKGEKFAQLVLSEVPKACWVEVEHVGELGEDRGGGFGSTGVK
jgi:dUTP pyrophosphatase